MAMRQVRRHAWSAGAALALVTLAGCGDPAETAGAGDPDETTEAPSASTTTELPLEAEPAESTPEAAAQQLLDAWSTGDRADADAVAAPDVVEALFASELDPSQVLFRGCREQPELLCTALLPGNRQITLTMAASPSLMAVAIDLPPAAP